jgi:hypothetical protein
MCLADEAETILRQRKGRGGAGTNKKEKTDEGEKKHKITSTKRHQRRCSYVHAEPPPVFYVITSKNADSVLAAVGAGLCLAILTYLSEVLQIPMMASFLVGGTIKMFYNREPPSLNAFWTSSIVLIPLGTFLHYVLTHGIGSVQYATPIILTVSMLYWKLSSFGELWAPANNLAIYVAAGSGTWGRNPLQEYPIKYIVTPYVSGHLFIYAFALVWSKVRALVRAKLVSREFFMNESNHLRSLSTSEQKQRLRDLFDRMDLDGNGRLDVYELQLAFRKALECDISLEESRLIMKSTDTDGDSTLDFHEFCAAMEQLLHG